MKAITTAQFIADELLHFNQYLTTLVLGSPDGKTSRIPEKRKILIRDIESSKILSYIPRLRKDVQWQLIIPTITDPKMEKAREKCYRE